MHSEEEGVVCTCPGCLGIPTADPVWGYDRSKVPEIECSKCDEPIGDEPFVEGVMLARFGSMFFLHKRCDKSGSVGRQAERARARRIKEGAVPPKAKKKKKGAAPAR